jgi:hypothetical protein
MPSRSEHHSDTSQISRTLGGGLGYWRNNNCQRNQDNLVSHGNPQGQQSSRGNVKQEVQQSTRPPCNRRDARPQGEAPPEASLQDAPMIDLRQKINDGHDTWRIIEARRRDHPGRYHNDDDNDRFPALTSNITEKSYPKDSKPVGIPKYDGKQDPRQWIRYYFVAIEVSGGSNSAKALYFPIALESMPLTWLESLKPNSIDSWEDLKWDFIDKFQGSMIRAGTHHDLSQVKQEMNEILRSYSWCFFEMRATIANITNEDVIRCFHNGLFSKHTYHNFGGNRPTAGMELCDMMARWADQEDEENDRFPKRNNDKQGNSSKHFDKGQRNNLGNPQKCKPDQEVVAVECNLRGKKPGSNHA